jgi:hypothetical protein
VAVVVFIDENRIRSAKMDVSGHLNRWHHRAESRRGRLQGELDAAQKLAEELRPKDDRLPAATTSIIEVELRRGGLRFDLRRTGEPLNTFKQRVNVAEREDPRKGPRVEPDDDRWLLGPNSISAGSLHCDVWSGPAIELLWRDTLCIKPVNGWWRDRAGREYVNKQTRYSLIVTLRAQNVDVDLYTPVKAVVDVPAAEIETAI